MDKKLYDLMNWPDIEGIIYSDGCNPKNLLGAHSVKGGILIQSFYPAAVGATVKAADGKTYEMVMADEEGYFAVLVPVKSKFAYTVEFRFEDGNTFETDDAYNYPSMIKKSDLKSFNEGNNNHVYKFLGAHEMDYKGVKGVDFAIWAPDALRVSVVGEFNNWDGRIHQLETIDSTGVFELFVPGVTASSLYKFEIRLKGGKVVLITDPISRMSENKSEPASLVCDNNFKWSDEAWLNNRKSHNKYKESPMAVYTYTLPDSDMTYKEITQAIESAFSENRFTHVILKNVFNSYTELSLDYDRTGYFNVNSRYGSLDDFKAMINALHKKNIGVLLQWNFDDINVARNEIANIMYSSASYIVEELHGDGIVADRIGNALYLDFERDIWTPNIFGGRENLEAVNFVRGLNEIFNKQYKDVITVADDRAGWPDVTGSVKEEGALGFDYSIDHIFGDNLMYFLGCDPLFRKGRYNKLSLSMVTFYNQDSILSLDTDGINALETKIPGRVHEDKMANLRAAFAYAFTHPGKKTVYSGNGEETWNTFAKALVDFYNIHPELSELDYESDGFEWINNISGNECVLSFVRKSKEGKILVVIANFTPVVRDKYKIGVPFEGKYKEIFNTDDEKFGGNGNLNKRAVSSKKDECDGRTDSIRLTLPPLGVVVLDYTKTEPKKTESKAAVKTITKTAAKKGNTK